MLGQNTCNVSELPPRIMKRYFPFELFPGLRMKWDPFQIFSSPSRRKDIVTNFSNVIKVITFGWVVSLLAIFFCLPLCRFLWSCSKTAKTIQKRPSQKTFDSKYLFNVPLVSSSSIPMISELFLCLYIMGIALVTEDWYWQHWHWWHWHCWQHWHCWHC